MNDATITDTLVNLPDIHIDKTLPVDIKKQDFVRQVDPYHYRVNSIEVNAIYPVAAPPFADVFERLRA